MNRRPEPFQFRPGLVGRQFTTTDGRPVKVVRVGYYYDGTPIATLVALDEPADERRDLGAGWSEPARAFTLEGAYACRSLGVAR